MFRKSLIIFFLALAAISCSKSDKKEKLQKFVNNNMLNDSAFVRNVLTNVPSKYHRLLLFSKNLCRKCFKKIINHFEPPNNKGQVVLIGANDYTIKRLNSIYGKSLQFWKGDFGEYPALQSHYPSILRSYIRYVEIDSSDTLIYKGRGRTIGKRTQDVLRFFVKRDTIDE